MCVTPTGGSSALARKETEITSLLQAKPHQSKLHLPNLCFTGASRDTGGHTMVEGCTVLRDKGSGKGHGRVPGTTHSIAFSFRRSTWDRQHMFFQHPSAKTPGTPVLTIGRAGTSTAMLCGQLVFLLHVQHVQPHASSLPFLLFLQSVLVLNAHWGNHVLNNHDWGLGLYFDPASTSSSAFGLLTGFPQSKAWRSV